MSAGRTAMKPLRLQPVAQESGGADRTGRPRARDLYSGIADVAALTGDTTYLERLTESGKTWSAESFHLTGGIGATGSGEAFGRDFELPNMTAYNETCAAIGADYWNYRLFLLHADARYIDVMERTLYNGLVSGVSLDGKSFFYPNPLESKGQHQRSHGSAWPAVRET